MRINMANSDIQPGDKVFLKSGGPKMTVLSIEGSDAICSWFDKTKPSQERFPLVALEKDTGTKRPPISVIRSYR